MGERYLIADIGISRLKELIVEAEKDGDKYTTLHALYSLEIAKRWREIHENKQKGI